MLKEKGNYYRLKCGHIKKSVPSVYKVLNYIDRMTSPTPSSPIKCECMRGYNWTIKAYTLEDYPINNRFIVGQACRTPKGRKIYMYIGDEGSTVKLGLRKRMEKFVDTKTGRYQYFEVGYMISAQDKIPSFNDAMEWLKSGCEESLL